jgi:hypothetical protein
MDAQDPPPGLSHDDALSLWVGRVARAHAHLEYGVDNVHGFLSRQLGSVPESRAVKGFDHSLANAGGCSEARVRIEKS